MALSEYFSDIYELHQSIAQHIQENGNYIYIGDRPHLLQLGWRCDLTQREWFITLYNIKRSSNSHVLLIDLFLTTEEKRLQFVATSPQRLEKILTLTAFM